MRDFKEYLKKLDTSILEDLLLQYKWETECNLDNHLEKITLIKAELRDRIN